MAGQVEQGLRKGSGSDLAERCDTGAPAPRAYPEQSARLLRGRRFLTGFDGRLTFDAACMPP